MTAIIITAMAVGALFVFIVLYRAKRRGAPREQNSALKISNEGDTQNGARACFDSGTKYLMEGKVEQALQALNQSISLDPSFFGAYYNRASIYFQRREDDKALADIDKAIQLCGTVTDFDASPLYYRRGSLYFSKKNYTAAMADYNKAIEINPNNIDAYYDRGRLYCGRNEKKKGIEDFSRCIQLSPGAVNAYVERAIAHDELGDSEKAIADFGEAIKLKPGSAYLYVERGVAYYTKGSLENAKKDWEHALQLEPGNKQAREYLSRIPEIVMGRITKNGELEIGTRVGDSNIFTFGKEKQ